MINLAILTAKGGNQTLADKNLAGICGRPSIYWPLSAALQAKSIDRVFVTTECSRIKEIARDCGAEIIDRPAALARPDSNHGDVILHAAKAALEGIEQAPATVTILLGNTAMTVAEDIDQAVAKTLSDPAIDSCMTVWKAQDDHPLRAMVVNPRGYLESYLGGETPDTNRQSYREVFFYDQGPWTVRTESLLRSETTREGPGPWWWMGRNCVPLQRLWVTGRDTHSPYDVEIAEWWLRRYRLAGRRNPARIEDYSLTSNRE